MKYISLIFIFFLASCGGSDNNPFSPVTEDGLIDTQAPANIADDPVEPEPIAAPQPTPEPISQPEPEPINEPITQTEPEPEIVEDPIEQPVIETVTENVEAATPESEIEGLWYCRQFGEDFTWELKPDRTIVYDNPGIFSGVIGTYWHIQEHTFALGYSSGGIAEFTCDGETLNGGSLNCSREPIVGD